MTLELDVDVSLSKAATRHGALTLFARAPRTAKRPLR
jgi:hypothetical protein